MEKALPIEYFNLYKTVINIKENYEEDLGKILILSKPVELKTFFRDVNTTLKYCYGKFNTSSIDSILLSKILMEIDKFIRYNLINARKYMKVEKEYKFTSYGSLTQADL